MAIEEIIVAFSLYPRKNTESLVGGPNPDSYPLLLSFSPEHFIYSR